jgi:hypothetical protein
MKSRAAHIGVVVVTSAFIFVTFFIRPITPTGKDKKTHPTKILFFSHFLSREKLSYRFPPPPDVCAGTALGMESGRIPDSDISASSSYARSVGPEHARYLSTTRQKVLNIFLKI